MSFIVKLIIGGWLSTFAIIGVCALNESGKLLKFRNRLASWIEVPESSSPTPDADLGPEGESAA